MFGGLAFLVVQQRSDAGGGVLHAPRSPETGAALICVGRSVERLP